MTGPLTAREIQAAFENGRRENNEVARLLLGEAPAFFVEHPEWLDLPCDAASICELQIALLLRTRLHGDVIRKLDQKICEYRELDMGAEQALFTLKSASPHVVAWIGRGELTFRRVLERSPHLLLVRWYGFLDVL